jgi:hypothetical protein
MPTLLAIDLVPSFLTHHDVATLFAWCPGFLRSALVVNAQGRSVGSAVIEVSNPGEAQRIIQVMDGVEIAGTAIRVSRLEGPPQEYDFGLVANATDEGGRTIRGEAMQQPCAHQRLVDHLRDAQDRPTGKLRCVECNAVFPDSGEGSRLSTSSE